jgi:hypothetical protein
MLGYNHKFTENMNGIESICRICLDVETSHHEYNLRAM